MQTDTESSLNIHRVRVAVPVYIYDCFDYKLSAEQYAQAEIGARVAVSFGRQNLVGIIVEKLPVDAPIDPSFKLKAITELLDDRAILDEKVLSLLTWSANYYQFPLGEVIQTALPSLLRQGKPYNLLATVWNVLKPGAENELKRSEKQRNAYKLLSVHPQGTSEHLLNLSGIENSTLKALQKKGLIDTALKPQDFSAPPVQMAQMPLTANPDQRLAIQQILKAQNK